MISSRPFYDMLSPHLPLVGAEIGVCRGESAELFLRTHSAAFLHLVDPNPIIELALPPRFQLHRLHSATASCLFQPASLDFVYIDGDHSYSAVDIDVRLWLPKVKPGGYVGGHDYFNTTCPGVRQVVNKYIYEHDCILNAVLEDWWIKLPAQP